MFISNNNLPYGELKEKYPKAIKELNNWVRNGLLAFQKQIATEESIIPQLTDSIIEKATEAMLQTSCRDLFDFFDINNISVEINKISTKIWTADIDKWAGESINTLTVGDYNSRIEAEIAGFEIAFGELEKLLTKG